MHLTNIYPKFSKLHGEHAVLHPPSFWVRKGEFVSCCCHHLPVVVALGDVQGDKRTTSNRKHPVGLSNSQITYNYRSALRTYSRCHIKKRGRQQRCQAQRFGWGTEYPTLTAANKKESFKMRPALNERDILLLTVLEVGEIRTPCQVPCIHNNNDIMYGAIML